VQNAETTSSEKPTRRSLLKFGK